MTEIEIIRRAAAQMAAEAKGLEMEPIDPDEFQFPPYPADEEFEEEENE